MIIDHPLLLKGKSNLSFFLACQDVREGKNVLFAYSDLKAGIRQLLFYFPGALIEVVGESGLQVWERKNKK